MRAPPSVPPVEDAPEGLFEGHLWLLEAVDGECLRVQLRASGRLRYGTASRVYDDPGAMPARYDHAVRAVEETFGRATLRATVDDVESVTLVGVATHHRSIRYDRATPSELWTDVWSEESSAFLPVDRAKQVLEGLGLEFVPVLAQELPARDFDPDDYEHPASALYDGPAAGVVVRNKRGDGARLPHPDRESLGETVPVAASAADLVARVATDRRLDEFADELARRERPVTVQALLERVLAATEREAHRQLDREDAGPDRSALRSAAARRVQTYLDREGDQR
jgi:hypothetical protein